MTHLRGRSTLAAACPFCTSMFEDGIKAKDAGDQIKLMDLAELVNLSMKRDGGTTGFAQNGGSADKA